MLQRPSRNKVTRTTSGDHTMSTNIYLEGNYAPVTEEVTAVRPGRDRRAARRARTAATCATGRTRSTVADPAKHHWFVGDGMVHGVRLRDGRAEWYRNRYVGSTRLSEARGQPDIPGPQLERLRRRPEHQRRRLRRHHVGDGRGRRLPGRADLRARDGRAQRLLRHAARRVHRPSQGRPDDRGDARDGLRAAAVAGPRAVRRGRRRRQGAPHRRHPARRRRRCCTTCRSPSATRSSSTSPAASTSRWR